MAQSPIINLPISTASSGDNTLVAAQSGKRIKVVNYLIVAAGAMTVTFYSSSHTGTALTGTMSMITGYSIFSGFAGTRVGGGYDCQFATNPGEALVLNLSTGTQVSGHLNYVLE